VRGAEAVWCGEAVSSGCSRGGRRSTRSSTGSGEWGLIADILRGHDQEGERGERKGASNAPLVAPFLCKRSRCQITVALLYGSVTELMIQARLRHAAPGPSSFRSRQPAPLPPPSAIATPRRPDPHAGDWSLGRWVACSRFSSSGAGASGKQAAPAGRARGGGQQRCLRLPPPRPWPAEPERVGVPARSRRSGGGRRGRRGCGPVTQPVGPFSPAHPTHPLARVRRGCGDHGRGRYPARFTRVVGDDRRRFDAVPGPPPWLPSPSTGGSVPIPVPVVGESSLGRGIPWTRVGRIGRR